MRPQQSFLDPDRILEVRRGVVLGSAAGHEGDDDVDGVSVDVLASSVGAVRR